MKKISLLAALASFGFAHAASAECSAPPPPGCPRAFQGIFIGGNLGYGVGGSNSTIRRFSNYSLDQFPKLRYEGLAGGIGGGYNQRLGFLGLPKWGTGLEVQGNWGNLSTKSQINDLGGPYSDNYKVKFKNDIQARANFFYVICEMVAPKVFLGWKGEKWSQQVTGYQADTGSWPGQSAIPLTKKSKRHSGFLWGMGVDFLAAKHVLIGFEYAGSSSNRKSILASAPGNNNLYGSFKPRTSVFSGTIKFIY